MTVPACLRLADEVFPKVRAAAARRLVAEGWSQARAAKAVGLSQAMVSRHVAAAVELDPLVAALADSLAEEVLHPQAAHGPSPWCATLTVGQVRPGGDAALADLLAAERLLRAANPIALVPQVGLNLARALPTSVSPDDVLAFPGRLVEAGGRLVSPVPPAFGGSGHLARCLLRLRLRDPGTLALANVRGGPKVAAAAKRLGLKVTVLAGDGGAEERFARAADAARALPDAFHDPGAVGLEPCLYLLAPDAQSAARRILALTPLVTV